MLDIAFELIEEATSNSLLMFCFCHLIIVMIFAGSSKPGSMDSQDSTFVTPVSYNMCYNASDDHACGDVHDCGDDHDDEAMTVVPSVPSAQDEPIDDSSSDEEEDEESSHCYTDYDNDDDDDDVDDDADNDDDERKEAEVEDEEGDDDLRKRVEEFIARINDEWRHEKLKALNLAYF